MQAAHHVSTWYAFPSTQRALRSWFASAGRGLLWGESRSESGARTGPGPGVGLRSCTRGRQGDAESGHPGVFNGLCLKTHSSTPTLARMECSHVGASGHARSWTGGRRVVQSHACGAEHHRQPLAEVHAQGCPVRAYMLIALQASCIAA